MLDKPCIINNLQSIMMLARSVLYTASISIKGFVEANLKGEKMKGKGFGKFALLLGAAALGIGLAGIPAHAYTLDPGATQTWEITNNNSNLNATNLQTITGVSGLLLLYKQDVGGGESGSLASSYSTITSPTGDESNFTTTYTGGSSASCPDCFLVVKDGKNDPNQYVFNLGSWNGTSTITGTGFWANNNGAISNVAIWGKATSVPEPASLMLLGVGLAGIGIWRRMSSKS